MKQPSLGLQRRDRPATDREALGVAPDRIAEGVKLGLKQDVAALQGVKLEGIGMKRVAELRQRGFRAQAIGGVNEKGRGFAELAQIRAFVVTLREAPAA